MEAHRGVSYRRLYRAVPLVSFFNQKNHDCSFQVGGYYLQWEEETEDKMAAVPQGLESMMELRSSWEYATKTSSMRHFKDFLKDIYIY